MLQFFTALGVLRAPIAVTIIAILMLTVPQQSRELFFAIDDTDDWLGWFQMVVFLALFLFALLVISIRLIDAETDYREEAVRENRKFLEAFSIVTPFTILCAVHYSQGNFRDDLILGVVTEKVFYPIIYGILSLLILFACKEVDIMRRAVTGPVRNFNNLYGKGSWWHGLLLATAGILTVNTVIVLYSRQFSDFMGPFGVIFMFLGVLCLVSALCTYVYDRYGIPVITVLGVFAAGSAFFSLNNNHVLSYLKKNASETTDQKTNRPLEMTDAFARWLKDRSDLKSFTDNKRPYPVYVVTAEGGGLYAAAHTASTLAKIQDKCPAFAKHIFAISGVSGGSLGAAVFSALVKSYPPPKSKVQSNSEAWCLDPDGAGIEKLQQKGKLQKGVEKFFSEDLLTPLFAAGLFPDFMQRFVPKEIPAYDRARALEGSFDIAWRKVIQADKEEHGRDSVFNDIFVQSVRKLWAANEDQPALLLNSTFVQYGNRVVISPFRLKNSNTYNTFSDLFIDTLNGSSQISLASGVGVSARFPVVTPPALHKFRPLKVSLQLVDGGYYENSGILTAINLLQNIQEANRITKKDLRQKGACAVSNYFMVKLPQTSEVVPVCVKIITIRTIRNFDELSPVGDITSVVSAALQVGEGRKLHSIVQANYLYCGRLSACGVGVPNGFPHVYVKYLNPKVLKLGLGWYLSNHSLEEIYKASEIGRGCLNGDSSSLKGLTKMQKQEKIENSCLYSRVYGDLE